MVIGIVTSNMASSVSPALDLSTVILKKSFVPPAPLKLPSILPLKLQTTPAEAIFKSKIPLLIILPDECALLVPPTVKACVVIVPELGAKTLPLLAMVKLPFTVKVTAAPP